MSFSLIEIDNTEVPIKGDNEKFQENEVPKKQLTNKFNMGLLKFSFSDIRIFGYVFKGPEKFTGSSKFEHLNKEISKFIDHSFKCSYGDSHITKRPQSNSLGNIAGLNEMSKLPIKFNNPSLEYLYSLNLNEWIIGRFPFIAFIYIISTIIFWPLTTFAFHKTSAWKNFPYIYITFHVIMAITLISISIPLICIWIKLFEFEERLCYWSLGMISFIWGLWNILATLESRPNNSEASLLKHINVKQAFKGLTFIYSILPIISLDSFLPTRTSKTWPIHLQFIILYSVSTFEFIFLNEHYVPWIYITFRITGYTSIILLAYFGSYSSDTQIRISFYNWLTSSRKISRLEKDISIEKIYDKPYAPAEVILTNVKSCLKMAHIIKVAVEDRMPELSDPIDQICDSMKICLTNMTTNKGLYAVSPKQIYKNLGNEADIINSYINSYYKPNKNNKRLTIETPPLKYQEPELFTLDNKRFANYIRTIPDFQNTVNLFQILNDWNFSILNHFKLAPNPFVSLGYCLLAEFESHFHIRKNIILNFLTVVEGLYNNVAYHNCIHGAFVAQKISCLANFIGLYDKMSSLDRAIMVISAICHDVGHPGKTNSFLVNSGHDVAHLFNDNSVLENFHCCLTFNILKMNECNIFSFLGLEEMRQVRRRIIELILATDMENHFEFISSFRVRRLSNDFSIENDLLNICKMLIKASDLGSTCISWDISFEWTQRLSYEFYSQGRLEMTMDLPVSALCDPERHIDFPKAQSGFLRLVVYPLFEEISKIPDYSPKDNSMKSDFIFINNDDPNSLNSSSIVGLSSLDSCEKVSKKYKKSSKNKLVSSLLHYEELIHGNIKDRYSYNPNECEICSKEFDNINESYQPSTNKVITICLAQLRDNAEEWDRMSELGQTIPYNEFPHENINLDIQLAIQT